MIHYQVVPESPEAHLFQLELRVDDPDPAGQCFWLPAWIRGSYLIRDYARHIITLEAECLGQPVSLEKLDKQTWRAQPCQGSLRISYRVYAWDLSVRGGHLDTRHAYFNGPCLFLAVAGREQEPCRLSLKAPAGVGYGAWRVATGMPVEAVDERGFGDYLSSDYEALLDYPVEMGEFESVVFNIDGIAHRIVLSGRHDGDLERLADDLGKVCRQQIALFGELPVSSYLFLLWVVGDGYGGLEHRNSSSLLCSREDLPHVDRREASEGYRRLLGLCSHEYFHLWNVKRITPEPFLQADTRQEVYTRQLWVFEGITSYYDDLALVRCGLIERDAYFELLAQTISQVRRGSGRLKQTLEESSFDSWTKFYKQDENAPNAIVSYYAKGALFALCLDLHIRLESKGAQSLDDVMGALWRAYGKPGVGLPEWGFERLASEVTGLPLAELFQLGVRSTRELPLARLLQPFGVEMHLLPARSPTDKGGVVQEPPERPRPQAVLGAATRQLAEGIQVNQVFDGGAAQRAGLAAGDLIIAVDGLRLTETQLQQRLARTPLGDRLPLHLFRRDELMELQLEACPAADDTCLIHFTDPPSRQQLQRLAAWLQSDDGAD